MDYMKLFDGTEIPIEGGSSLGSIVHIAETEEDALEVCEAITPENLVHVEFWQENGEEAYGVYDHLTMDYPPTRQTNEDETVTVTISLREQTELERRVAALEESQAVQDGAIDDLGTVLSDMMEEEE